MTTNNSRMSLEQRLSACLATGLALFLLLTLTSLDHSSAVASLASPVITCAPSPRVQQPHAASSTDGTPVAIAATVNASPVAVAATPAAPETSASTVEAIESVTYSLAVCLTTGNIPGISNLATEQYLGQVYGDGDSMPYETFAALAPDLPRTTVRIDAIAAVRVTSVDRASADVTLVVGNHLRQERWDFVFQQVGEAGTPQPVGPQGFWQVDAATVLPVIPPAIAMRMTATVTENQILLNPMRVSGTNVVITASNVGNEPHELLVLRQSLGAKVETLLQPPTGSFPPGIAVSGQITLLPGETGEMILVDLEPGVYTVICLLPDANGVPHLALGEQTTFTVR